MTQYSLEEINHNTYTKKKVILTYNKTALQKAEAIIINSIKSEITNKKILDIGIGCGRTSMHLYNLSKNYIGIDYSPQMINACKQRYPFLELQVMDVRNMSTFDDMTFDFIFFTYNGIDYVSNTNRLQILKELWRILRKGGYFCFSSHNKTWADFNILKMPEFKFTYNIKRILKNIYYILTGVSVGLLNHWRNKKHEIHTDAYSIINDPAHNYSLLTYYISYEKQIEQLNSIADDLSFIKAYDENGNEIFGDSKNSCWIHYLIKK